MGTNENPVLAFTRSDSVVGVGFSIDIGGCPLYSVAWPDRSPDRIDRDGLAACGIIEVNPVNLNVAIKKADDFFAPPSTEVIAAGDTPESKSEAQHIRDVLTLSPELNNAEVIASLKEKGVTVTSSQVSRERNKL